MALSVASSGGGGSLSMSAPTFTTLDQSQPVQPGYNAASGVAAPPTYYQTGGVNGSTAGTWDTVAPQYSAANNAGTPPPPTTYTAPNGQTYASQAAYQVDLNRLQGQNDASRDLIMGGAHSSIDTGMSGYNAAANSLFGTLRNQQQSINSNRENIEMGRMISMDDLVNGIRAGLQGGGIQLSNNNAADSSAGEAMSRAYSQFGGQQGNKIAQQAAQGQHTQDIAQGNLDTDRQTGMANLTSQRDSLINSVASDTTNKLNLLNQTATSQGLSSYDVAAMRQQIINEGTSKLSNVDTWLSGQLAGVNGEGADQYQANAYTQRQAGGAPQNPYAFEYSTQPGISQDNPLAPTTQLGLYTRPRNDNSF